MPFIKYQVVNIRSSFVVGYTPLHRALKERHIELAVLLQRYGASSDIPDKYHRHALSYCISDMPQEVKFVKTFFFFRLHS